MTLPSTTPLAGAFVRLAISLAILAWSIWSLRRIWAAISDIRSRWGTWDTHPIPDMRATRNLAILCALLAGWALFTAGLTFGLAWVAGV